LKLSVIIPCYDEKETIEKILKAVKAVQLASEIVVVDDGSKDGTRDILKALPPDPMVRIIFHDHNQGKGAAVRTGFREARGDIFLIQDAISNTIPRDYPILLKPIEEGRAKVVYGSRFLGAPHKTMFFLEHGSQPHPDFYHEHPVQLDPERHGNVLQGVYVDVVKDLPLPFQAFRVRARDYAKVLKRGYRHLRGADHYMMGANGRRQED